MAFWTVDNTKVELQLAGVWTDITSKVRLAEGITINRGRADEAARVDPSQCTLVLDNRDGRFSWRKPDGPYYGIIGRNTPLRVSVRPPGASKRVIGTATGTGSFSAAATPDSAGLSITGDLDLRYDASLPDWAPNAVLLSKYVTGQLSYRIYMNHLGYPVFQWSSDGSTELTAAATAPVPVQFGRLAVRATLDVNNGAGGRTITFYTAPTLAGPWTQLGAPVVQAGVTSIFDSTTALAVSGRLGGAVYGAEIRQGIGGTVRAAPDFTTQAEGATSFTDSAGTLWTVGAQALITAWQLRFTGEVATWPTQWGVDERDIRTPIAAAGITRRLGQGAASLQSALRRGIGNEANLVAYWPMEDTEGSTTLASAVSGGVAMRILAGTPELAADDTIHGSKPLPIPALGAIFQGAVRRATPGTIVARVAFYVPPTGSLDGTIMAVYASGGILWELIYLAAAGGTLGMSGRSLSTFATVAPFQTTHTGVNGFRWQAVMEIKTSGANIRWDLGTVNIDTDSGLGTGNTVAASSVGYATQLVLNPERSHIDIVMGHPHVLSALPTNIYGLEDYVRGQVPETPGRRIERLAAEEGIPFLGLGYLGPLGPQSAAQLAGYQGMGPQPIDTLLDTLEDAALVDLGMLIEPRDMLGLSYRTRESLYRQPAALAIDYSVLGSLEPIDDDQSVRNDVTVNRIDGSTARQRLESGPLSVLPPPNGVGIYDDQVDLNVQLDSALLQQANWRLHLGTVDEARYPSIALKLAHPAFVASSELTRAALDLDQGDLLTISNPPEWVPPDTIRQLAQGFTEVITDTGLDITVNCTPASPWEVAALDGGSRLDSEATTLAEDLTTTETDVTVTITAGSAPWVTTASHPGEFPFDIVVGGEAMTVTACTGATSPQTFTVTRSVNGVEKTHAAGASVRLRVPAVIAL